MALNPYTTGGAKVYVSAAVTAAPSNVAAYAALTWTEIGNVRSISPFGDTREVKTILVVGREIPRKKLGYRDAGTLTLTVYPDDTDAGQAALSAAASTRNLYPFRIDYPSGSIRFATGTPSQRFFVARIGGKQEQLGAADDIVTAQFPLVIASGITRNAALGLVTISAVGTAAGIGGAAGVGRSTVASVGTAAGAGETSTLPDGVLILDDSPLVIDGNYLVL